MRRPSLDEILGGAAPQRDRPSLDEILGGGKPRPSLDEIMRGAMLPDWTAGKALKGGTADVFNRNAAATAMNTAEITHTRDNTAIEDIWSNPSLTTVEKAALMRNAQNDPELLQGIMDDRAAMQSKLKSIADAVDPGEYKMPESLAGRFTHDLLRSAPFTAGSEHCKGADLSKYERPQNEKVHRRGD